MNQSDKPMKEIYLKAIQSVIDGKLSKDELCDVILDHLAMKQESVFDSMKFDLIKPVINNESKVI